jgi:hypothetical protein
MLNMKPNGKIITETCIKGFPNFEISNINYHVKRNPLLCAYSIIDFLGKTFLTGKVLEENSLIDISRLAVGMNLLRVGEDAKHTIKLIKQ